MHDPDRYRPKERFSDRVDDYRRSRPGYPPALTSWLLAEAGLAVGDAVADLGAGTGLLTRELLAAGLRVHAVEPNAAMRAVAEAAFAHEPGFVSVAGSAEATTLPADTLRLVVAAQAFHWFDPEAARAEALRVLAPGGSGALVWNVRRLDDAFARDYEALLMTHCPDYAAGQPHQADPGDVARWFGPSRPRTIRLGHAQRFDRDGLRARLLSSSYTPKAGDPARAPLLAALDALFERHAEAGAVQFRYDCCAWAARLRD